MTPLVNLRLARVCLFVTGLGRIAAVSMYVVDVYGLCWNVLLTSSPSSPQGGALGKETPCDYCHRDAQ